VRRAAAAAAAALLLSAAGCDVNGTGGGDDEANGPREVTTTRVQVVEGLGKEGGFDPGAIYDRLSPGVVTILSIFNGGASLLEGGEGGQGSGFVIDGNGYITTNAHVVTTERSDSTVRADQVYVEFSDGNRVPARIVGEDPNADVALLKVDPQNLSLTPLHLGDSDSISVGEPVAAIGSPFGEDQSLSVGVISATNRTVEGLTNFGIDNAIQTDASINPGNSGGPLLDAKGQVIGINEQIASSSGSNSGVGFAIPVTSVRYSLDQLKADGKVEYAYLGVTSESLYPQLAEHLGIDSHSGALISDVVNGSPADKAGLKGSTGETTFQLQHIKTGGDVVVAVDGKPVLQNNDLSKLIAVHKPGDTVTLDIIRDGHPDSVDVTLGSRPADVNQ